MRSFSLYLMAFFYFAAGINHFINPDYYLPLMPTYIPEHNLMVALSGAFEIALALLLLFRRSRSLAAWGIIAMLLVFFSVHIYMLQFRHTTFQDIPEWLLWARIPLQFVFIYWAFVYTEPKQSSRK